MDPSVWSFEMACEYAALETLVLSEERNHRLRRTSRHEPRCTWTDPPPPPAWPGRRVRFADLLVARDKTPAPIEAGVRVLDEDMKTDPAPRLAHDPVAATGSRHQEIPWAPVTRSTAPGSGV